MKQEKYDKFKLLASLTDTTDILSATIDNLRTCYDQLSNIEEFAVRQTIDLTIDYLALAHRTVKKRIYYHLDSLTDKPLDRETVKFNTKGC